MFLTRLFQLLLGYVSFIVDGGNPEKFLNLTARAGITLWNLKREGTALSGSTLASNYKKLLPEAEKAGVHIRVTKRRGLPVIIHKHSRRFGFIAGVALFFAILWYFSGFIWTVDISGNNVVATNEITYTLSDLGLRPGVRVDEVNLKNVEQRALILLPDLSWMHINLSGGTAQVAVGERTFRPEIVPDNRPCNVKASQTGQIISIQVYQGTTTLKAGETVLKGGLLASGIVQETKTGVTRYVHARANVIARTKHEISVTVPYHTTQKVATGKVEKKYTFDFLGLEIPLFRTVPTGNFIRTVYKNPLQIGGLKLPVAVTTSVFSEYNQAPVVYSKMQAVAEAKEQLAFKENTELSNAKITGKSYQEKANALSLTITGNYNCEEDIAYEEEVSIGGK
jgi:similar to stage IV sporulation protein